jgi:hypothetical protein
MAVVIGRQPVQLVGGAMILVAVVIEQTGGTGARAASELRIADE